MLELNKISQRTRSRLKYKSNKNDFLRRKQNLKELSTLFQVIPIFRVLKFLNYVNFLLLQLSAKS